jgi:hypothetical protein
MSISETFSKVHAFTLKVRLQDLHETLAPEFSGGFRQGRGRGDCACAAKSTLRQRKKHGLDSHVIAWGICKCFDKIPRGFTWASMRKMGVDEGTISAVASTLVDTECVLHVEGIQETVHMKQGTAQGTSLGPVLCLHFHFLLPMLNLWHDKIQSRHTTTWRHTTD